MHEHDRDQPVDVGGLYMDRVPRATLEDELVEGLKGGGMLPRPNAAPGTWALRAAAGALLFLSGWGTAQLGWGGAEGPGPARTGDGLEVDVGERYMLLLWEGPEFRADRSLAEEYGGWGRAVGALGVSISGDELGTDRTLFGPTEVLARGVPPAVGPPSEYRLGGYFMIGAGEEEVAELAENHPHRRYGGWVEVAPVVVR